MTIEEAIKVLRTESVEIGGNAVSVARFLTALSMAVSALTEQQDVPDTDVGKNEPLTMDELRNMDGEPAWFVSMRDGFASWGIVRVVEMSKAWFIAVAGAERAFGDIDGYGKTWIAYRQKPEEWTV